MKKAMVAVLTVIGMFTLSVPAMAAANTQTIAPQRPALVAEAVTPSGFGITPMDKMMYVTADLLHIRAIPSTEGEIINSFVYGTSLKVTGVVNQNIDGMQWYRVVVNGKEGFASADFLADNLPAATVAAPAVQQAPAAVQQAPAAAPVINTNNGSAPIIKTSYVYDAFNGDGLVQIQKDANGKWHYGDGGTLTWVTDYDAITDMGDLLTSYNPATQTSPDPVGLQEALDEVFSV